LTGLLALPGLEVEEGRKEEHQRTIDIGQRFYIDPGGNIERLGGGRSAWFPVGRTLRSGERLTDIKNVAPIAV
jgi:hypothetical protein